MRSLLFILLLSLLCFSCRVVPPMGKPVSHQGVTYVKTKDGKIIHPAEVKARHKKVIIDNDEVPASDVLEYCNGKDSFMRAGKVFARKTMSGDINIYSTTATYTTTTYTPSGPGGPGGFQTTNHSHTSVYLQSPSSPALMLMNYKNVRSLIKRDDPGYKYILAYERKRRAFRIWEYSSLGVMIGGIATVASVKPTSTTAAVGALSICAGALSGFSSLIAKGLNLSINLDRAISRHNGMMHN